MFERYSFVALTTEDLGRARRFWVERLGFAVTEEEAGHFFIVDAGGLRLCVDLADGKIHVAGGTDPVIGLKVRSLDEALGELAQRGVVPSEGPFRGEREGYAVLRDPDGRAVILTETD
jgi:catechol 2,3-dioxygenase-like lactoylglutathione lyase family enzyme